MNKVYYENIKLHLIKLGYEQEIKDIKERLVNPMPLTSTMFFLEYVWVVLNSGMKMQIAAKIYEKVIIAFEFGIDISNVFKHKKKCEAINYTLSNLYKIFDEYKAVDNKIDYLQTLKHIGKVTKYHLARNLGIDCVKPDRHLVRIAAQYKMTPLELCIKLSDETGDKLGVVDVVLWRAGNLGVI